MSRTLYWRPAPKDVPSGRELPDRLRHSIAPRFWGRDGSCKEEPIVVGKELAMYIEGLSDAGIDGADDLLAAIRAHGQVELWIDE